MFGPYKLQRTIGEGEFGKVKLAVHYDTGKEVAIKLIKKENIESPNRRAKLMREISILQALDHPFIVKLIEVIETEQYIGMVLEYASGGELFEHILAHRYLKERDACRFFAQLIAGVHYLHALHIVHRDLKLENLLLDGQRNIIITDFGFANRSSVDKDALLMTSCGSPCYAAPELVISDGYVGEAADIWSCGVILYAMLCGYLPFDDDPQNPDGDNINLLYKYILETELDFPDYISEDARDLLRKMLVPDPRGRAGMRDVMAHRWLAPYAYYFREETDSELDSPRPMEGIEPSSTSFDARSTRSHNTPTPDDQRSQKSYATPPASPSISRTGTPVPGVAQSPHSPHAAYGSSGYGFDIPQPTPGVQAVLEHDSVLEGDEEGGEGGRIGGGGVRDSVVEVPAVPVAPVAVNVDLTGRSGGDGRAVGNLEAAADDEGVSMMDVDRPQSGAEEVVKVGGGDVVGQEGHEELKVDTLSRSNGGAEVSVSGAEVVGSPNAEHSPVDENGQVRSSSDVGPGTTTTPSSTSAVDNKENTLPSHIAFNEPPRGRARAGSASASSQHGSVRGARATNYARGKSVDRPEMRSVMFSGDAKKEGRERKGKDGDQAGRKSFDVRRSASKSAREGSGILSWFKKGDEDVSFSSTAPTHSSSPSRTPTTTTTTTTRPVSIQESEHSHTSSHNEPLPRPSLAPSEFTLAGHSPYVPPSTTSKHQKLRYHSGPIDQRALSNKHPAVLIGEVVRYLQECGMEVRGGEGEFKVKVWCRFGEGGVGSGRGREERGVGEKEKDGEEGGVGGGGGISDPEDFDEGKLHHHLGAAPGGVNGTGNTVTVRPSVDSIVSRTGSAQARAADRERKRRGAARLAAIIASFPVSLVRKLRYFREYGPGWNKGFSGKGDLTPSFDPTSSLYASEEASLRGSVSNLYLPRTSLALSERYPTPSSTHATLPVGGPGNVSEEIRFTVEVQKIKNLPGLYVVEFKRLRGDIWMFKRVYMDVVGGLRGVAFRGVGEV
ncbi:hypothetical protein HDV00_005985 [Rhizophlyctis rosea]|nr:hypothetical protein HDV00_005985 [Rhizophlyctis rosea]